MISLKNIIKNHIIIKHIYYKRLIGNKGTYIMKEDWDNLIILDGCRYDMFEKLNTLNGKLEYRTSRGSCTDEFLRENFKGKKFRDTVYVTANPLIDYLVPKSFAKIVSVWKDGWYDEFGTVLPATMVEYTLKANKEFPDKRLIIHFVQPHYPFIGKKSREKIGKHDGMLARNLFIKNGKTVHATQVVWNLLKNGKVDKETVWEAYEENLQIVLKYVKELIDNLEGKIVVTSDHGNLFGEWLFPFPVKEYGHPSSVFVKNLIKVPWFIIDGRESKRITESEDMEDAKIQSAIRKLSGKI